MLLRRDGVVWKYLFTGRNRRDFREYLFNLAEDPAERANLLANGGATPLADEMRRLAGQEFNRPIPPHE